MAKGDTHDWVIAKNTHRMLYIYICSLNETTNTTPTNDTVDMIFAADYGPLTSRIKTHGAVTTTSVASPRF